MLSGKSLRKLTLETEKEITGQRSRRDPARLGTNGISRQSPTKQRALQQGERAWRKAAQVAAIKAKSEKAVKRALDLAPILKELEAERIISANAKAAALNERHVPTALGKRWTARSVINVQERIKEFSKQ